MDRKDCPTCAALEQASEVGKLDISVEDGKSGPEFPPEVARLEVLGRHGQVRRCGDCGTLYLYSHGHDYDAYGPSYEDYHLERVEDAKAEVVAPLFEALAPDALDAAFARALHSKSVDVQTIAACALQSAPEKAGDMALRAAAERLAADMSDVHFLCCDALNACVEGRGAVRARGVLAALGDLGKDVHGVSWLRIACQNELDAPAAGLGEQIRVRALPNAQENRVFLYNLPDDSGGIQMVHVPAGDFLMGDEKSTTHMEQGFWIGRFPTTWREYRAFCAATGREKPSRPGPWSRVPGEEDPVVKVSWLDAVAFCQWAGLDLPTEAEWEKAARGTDGRVYPWGDDQPTSDRCVFREFGSPYDDWWDDYYGDGADPPRGTSPVVDASGAPSRLAGVSPVGAHDMAGNVWEWCRDPSQGSSGRALRGGSYSVNLVPRGDQDDRGSCRSAFRPSQLPDPDYGWDDIGFRVCLRDPDVRADELREVELQHGVKPRVERVPDIRAKQGSTPEPVDAGRGSTRPALPEESASRAAPETSIISPGTWWDVAPEQQAYAEKMGIRVWIEDEVAGQRFVLIPPGTFIMGSAESERDDEWPQHRVTLTKGFYLGAMVVTDEVYRRFRPDHSSGRSEQHRQPVVNVSWNDIAGSGGFFARLNEQVGRQDLYRLPTEAEWEYACRAGTTTTYFWGDDKERASRYAPKKEEGSKPVGSFEPNRWGLYDMLGNVCEFCLDGKRNYAKWDVTDPRGPAPGVAVARGGPLEWSSAAHRGFFSASHPYEHCGFRMVREVDFAPQGPPPAPAAPPPAPVAQPPAPAAQPPAPAAQPPAPVAQPPAPAAQPPAPAAQPPAPPSAAPSTSEELLGKSISDLEAELRQLISTSRMPPSATREYFDSYEVSTQLADAAQHEKAQRTFLVNSIIVYRRPEMQLTPGERLGSDELIKIFLTRRFKEGSPVSTDPIPRQTAIGIILNEYDQGLQDGKYTSEDVDFYRRLALAALIKENLGDPSVLESLQHPSVEIVAAATDNRLLNAVKAERAVMIEIDRFLVRNADGTASLRPAESDELFAALPGLSKDGPYAVSPDRRWLAAGSDPVQLWDLHEGKLRHSIGSNNIIHKLRFTPDSAGLLVITLMTPQSGMEDEITQRTYDVHTGSLVDERSWWERQ